MFLAIGLVVVVAAALVMVLILVWAFAIAHFVAAMMLTLVDTLSALLAHAPDINIMSIQLALNVPSSILVFPKKGGEVIIFVTPTWF